MLTAAASLGAGPSETADPGGNDDGDHGGDNGDISMGEETPRKRNQQHEKRPNMWAVSVPLTIPLFDLLLAIIGLC